MAAGAGTDECEAPGALEEWPAGPEEEGTLPPARTGDPEVPDGAGAVAPEEDVKVEWVPGTAAAEVADAAAVEGTPANDDELTAGELPEIGLAEMTGAELEGGVVCPWPGALVALAPTDEEG